AVESHASGTIINRLLHKAFSVAKRVRSETGVASSAVSISYAAVELARRIFDDMDHHDALIIGAGEMAELAAMHLKQAGIRRLLVSNRTFSRAEDLAASLGGTAVPFDSLMETLAECDIVISSTGAPGIIISGQDMRGVLKKRRHRPMFLIDIAMPRDIDPAVNQLDNIYLYDIDDLKEVVEENLAGRREEAVKAWSIVEEETKSFMQWMDSLALQPAIVALGERGRRIMEEELAKTLRRLGPVDDATREALEVMADSLVRRFNHEPIAFLKDRFHETRDPAHTLQAVDTIKRVCKLD
ncbi:MAG: glutamyl-tRNA reductase, partial [Mailhella sp.]|nr:glutamyl-tRNA reductase [Mailhella sp.]